MHYLLFPGMLLLDKSSSNKPETLEDKRVRVQGRQGQDAKIEKEEREIGRGRRHRNGERESGREKERERFIFVLLPHDSHIE